MKKGLAWGVGVLLSAGALSAVWGAESARPPIAKSPTIVAVAPQQASLRKLLNSRYTKEQLQAGTYVGSEFCLACHSEYQGWKSTKHAMSIRRPMEQYSLIPGKGVVADYDRNGVDDFIQGLDFNQISSVYDAYEPNAPVLSVESGKYTITIGQVKMPVVFVNGGTGDWRERYGVRIPASDSPTGYSDEVYFSPVQFNEDSKSYFAYKITNWYGTNKQPLVQPGMTRAAIGTAILSSFSKNCVGCHITGIRSAGKTAQGEWVLKPYPAVLYQEDDPAYFDYDGDGLPDLMNIGCEMCHGPGSAHILGGGDPAKIVNPGKLSADKSNEVCGRCHNRVRSVPNKTYAWPYHDDTGTQWAPNTEPLATYFANNNSLWPDGETSYEHNQHYSEMLKSPHFTNPYQKLRCFDCHDPHQQANAAQIIPQRTQGGVTIQTGAENNTLCLSCHATHGPFAAITTQMVADYAANVNAIGGVVSAHAHHPYGPERIMGLARCTSCHMPRVSGAEHESAIHTHQFIPQPPEKTLKYQAQGGMPNACGSTCHREKVNLWGYGIAPDFLPWTDPVDVKTATKLMDYYGPQGQWWQVTLP